MILFYFINIKNIENHGSYSCTGRKSSHNIVIENTVKHYIKFFQIQHFVLIQT